MKKLIKRVTSLLLAVMLLCTPVHALDWSDIPDDLLNTERLEALFNNEELQKNVQRMLENVQSIKEQIKAMSDEELEQTIIELAKQYNIPEMNQEQLDFLVDVCRSLETIENIGETVEEYKEKLNTFQRTMKALSETFSNILDTFNGMMDKLSGFFGKFSGA